MAFKGSASATSFDDSAETVKRYPNKLACEKVADFKDGWLGCSALTWFREPAQKMPLSGKIIHTMKQYGECGRAGRRLTPRLQGKYTRISRLFRAPKAVFGGPKAFFKPRAVSSVG